MKTEKIRQFMLQNCLFLQQKNRPRGLVDLSDQHMMSDQHMTFAERISVNTMQMTVKHEALVIGRA